MTTYFGHAAVTLALLAGTSAASAQQWVREPERVIVREQVPLTQAQRTIIYRTITPQGRGRGPIVRERIVTEPVAPAPVVRERVVAPIDAYAYGDVDDGAPPARRWVAEPDDYSANAYAVGTRIPARTRIAPLPPAVVAQVPAVRSYSYVRVAGRVLLVDPDTGVVLANVTP